MATTTPINGWPLAESGDNLDIEEAILELAAEMDDDLLPVMSTPTRNATIAPSEGMLSYVTDRQTMEIFDGTIWREADKTRRLGVANVQLPDTTLRDIPGLSYRVAENGVYYFDGIVAFSAPAADDIVFQWELPASTTGRWILGFTGNVSSSVTSAITVATLGANAAHLIGYFQVQNAGVCQLQARKNTDTTTDARVFWRSVAWNFTRIL